MINIDDLYIVNYCHPNCIPLKNIMWLPKEDAFKLAFEMSVQNKDTTAFYRFADFENYYPRRLKADQLLYNAFLTLGGNPKFKHPLSFVLQGSEYLDKWFDNGIITKVSLKNIPSEFISFTYGDSMAATKENNTISLITKDMLLESIRNFKGTLDEYMKKIITQYHYIETQLWDDAYCSKGETLY